MNTHLGLVDDYLPAARRPASPGNRYLLAGAAARMVADLLVDFDPPPRWRLDGACRSDEHVDLFDTLFESAPDAESPTVEAARAVCAGCPVRITCLLSALLCREPDGMWGGLMPAERDLLVRRRPARRRQPPTISDLDSAVGLADVLDEIGPSAREGARRTGMDKEAVTRWRAQFAARLDRPAAA